MLISKTVKVFGREDGREINSVFGLGGRLKVAFVWFALGSRTIMIIK